jgi:hypothetical protein
MFGKRYYSFWLLLLSSYKYSWDENLKQPNEDAILIIRFCITIISIISIAFLIKHRRNKKNLNLFFL